MLYYEGVDLKTIRSRLGHADVSTTANWYIHFSRKAGQEAAQVASKLVTAGIVTQPFHWKLLA